MTIKRNLVRAATAVAGATIVVAAGSPTATAATARNGICEPGEFCFYWGANRTQSLSDFNGSLENYGETQPSCYEFKGPGLGRYECIKNNAGSAWNRTTSYTVRVYFRSGHQGEYDDVAAGVWRDLDNTWLNNASHLYFR